MINIKIDGMSANEGIDVAQQLKKNGYIMGTDFDFTYIPPKQEYFSGEMIYNKSVVFTFYKEELATYFGLRYL